MVDDSDQEEADESPAGDGSNEGDGSDERSSPSNPSSNLRADNPHHGSRLGNMAKREILGDEEPKKQGGIGKKVAQKVAQKFAKKTAEETTKAAIRAGGAEASLGATVAAELIARQARANAQAALQAVKGNYQQAFNKLKKSPLGRIILIVCLILLFLFILLFFGLDENCQDDQGGAGGPQETLTVTLSKTGPPDARAGDLLIYEVKVADTQPDKDITIVDHLPDNVSLAEQDISSSWTKMKIDTTDTTTHTITWHAADNLSAAPPPGNNVASSAGGVAASGSGTLSSTNFTFTVTLKATADNSFVINYVDATPLRSGNGSVSSSAGGTGGTGGCKNQGGGQGGSSQGYVPSNKKTCPGKPTNYILKNPLGNYGDPDCSFNKNDLDKLLKEKDPANANKWFSQIIPCESGYDPNAYAGIDAPGQAALDTGGAWGLYQMGSSAPPGQAPPAPGKNGPDDRGDVNWQVQTTNAIDHYNKAQDFSYWACARSQIAPLRILP